MPGRPYRLPVRARQRLQVCIELPGSFDEVLSPTPSLYKTAKEVAREVEVLEIFCTFGNPAKLENITIR